MEYNKIMKLKGEASLELAISIFCALLLLVATARVFVWLNERMVLRQVGRANPQPALIGYEQSRVEAGSVKSGDTRCSKCYTNIKWINVNPSLCHTNAGDWRYLCMAVEIPPQGPPPQCVWCVHAESWSTEPDSTCQSSLKPPERRCAQRESAPLEIQVNETNYPRLNIFENWPHSR